MTDDEQFDVAGSVTVVTGATRGIGKQVALALGRAGAKVVLVGRTSDAAPNPLLPGTVESVASEMAAEGIEARSVQADLTDPEATERVVERTLAWYGRCDVLINNAGYTSNGPILEVPSSRWQKAFRVQVVAPLHLVQGFVPGMLERGSGRVVNVSSSGAVKLAANHSLYSVSKQAMERWTEYLDLELGGRGVSFNVLQIETLVTTEGWQYVYDTQGEEIATMGGVNDRMAPEEVGAQIEWMVRQPARWSGNIVGCREVMKLAAAGD
jgi:gluconate 5-dehydrogenase